MSNQFLNHKEKFSHDEAHVCFVINYIQIMSVLGLFDGKLISFI